MNKETSVYIGYISKTRGLKGEIQLFFEFEDYQELDVDLIFIDHDGKLVPYFIDQIKIHENSTAYVYLEDVDHIDKATPLLRKQVYIPQDKVPVRDEDDFRIKDLVGYFVIDEEHGDLGTIMAIHEYPQQQIAAVQVNDKEVLFPINDDMISFIDFDEKTITVQLPDGLIDLYLSN
jgi:16S rRNA processing protein RimM